MWKFSEPTQEETDGEFLMTDPMALENVETYWKSLAPTGQIPNRSSIDPAKLNGVIENCMVLERVAPGVARIRVAGGGIRDLAQTEPRGLPVSAMFHHEARAELTRTLEQVFRMPAIAEIPVSTVGRFGQPALDGRLLLLPLEDGFGRVSRCLGVLVMSGKRGNGARRLTINSGPKRLEPVQHLRPVGDVGRDAPTLRMRGKAEDVPALRLVVDNA